MTKQYLGGGSTKITLLSGQEFIISEQDLDDLTEDLIDVDLDELENSDGFYNECCGELDGSMSPIDFIQTVNKYIEPRLSKSALEDALKQLTKGV